MIHSNDVAKFLLGDIDFDGLDSFFGWVLTSNYTFKVAMARRCFNLCHLLRGSFYESDQSEIITDNALLLYAADFADYYRKHGSFPSLLLFDDVMLYGRAVYNALYRLEELVLEILQSEGEDVGRRTVHQELHAATDILVYAMGDTTDVIDNSFLYKVNCFHHRYGSEMLQLTRNISHFLTGFGEANTSHVLSVQTKTANLQLDDCFHRKRWRLLSLGSRVDQDEMFLCVDETDSMRAVHAFKRSVNNVSVSWLTGFPCVTSIKSEALEDVCSSLAKEIEKTGKSEKLVQALTSSMTGYAGFKMSLLSFIDSAETLYQLTSEMNMNWSEVLENSDLPRITRSFGKGKDIDDAFYVILHSRNIMSRYSRYLRSKAECVSIGRLNDVRNSIKGPLMQSENLLCDVGMDSEVEAYEYSHNLRTFMPLAEDHGKKPLKEYLFQMCGTRDKVDTQIVACEMFMLRYGINSMKFDTIDSGEVTCYLKAGELSTHTFPQRHKYLLPSLARIETAALAHSYPPARLLKLFIESLADEQEDESLEKNLPQELLADLYENISWYVDKTYKAGKSMARWNEIIWMDEASYAYADLSACDRLSELLLDKAAAFLRQRSRYATVNEA